MLKILQQQQQLEHQRMQISKEDKLQLLLLLQLKKLKEAKILKDLEKLKLLVDLKTEEILMNLQPQLTQLQMQVKVKVKTKQQLKDKLQTKMNQTKEKNPTTKQQPPPLPLQQHKMIQIKVHQMNLLQETQHKQLIQHHKMLELLNKNPKIKRENLLLHRNLTLVLLLELLIVIKLKQALVKKLKDNQLLNNLLQKMNPALIDTDISTEEYDYKFIGKYHIKLLLYYYLTKWYY